MQIKVGLKTGDLVGLDHKEVVVSSGVGLTIFAPHGAETPEKIQIEPGKRISLTATGDHVVLHGAPGGTTARGKTLRVTAAHTGGSIMLRSEPTETSPAKPLSTYRGAVEVIAQDGSLRLILETDLESYVQGVLQSEVPDYFKLEAMKAQAVLARTYGLHPRLPHTADNFNVCDSYLHCQAFYGVKSLSAMQQQAITSTKGQGLLYNGKPALAVFSACAGGHTENYEFVFSDPTTGAFPSPPISYLKGVPEGKLPSGFPSEAAMRVLYKEANPQTDDAWSPHNFRWQVSLSANALEGHMHHVVQELRKDPQFGPFIQPPESGQFGHIQKFEINQRGVAGTAISMSVHTSAGAWTIRKELTIRSVFQNPDENLKRLKSARIFFDHKLDNNGLLSNLSIYGFGSGHGVGLQQIGAQGLASQGFDYKQILQHYYHGTTLGPL